MAAKQHAGPLGGTATRAEVAQIMMRSVKSLSQNEK